MKPISPGGPIGPGSPLRPFSPFGPGSMSVSLQAPLMPGSPTSPTSPFIPRKVCVGVWREGRQKSEVKKVIGAGCEKIHVGNDGGRKSE